MTASPELRWSEDLEEFHEESSRTHFIDVHTRWALRRAVPVAGAGRGVVLDVGCSSGYLVEELRADCPDGVVVGIDMLPAGLRRARRTLPDAPLIVADSTRLPLADSSVDLVLSANMLEHVNDDREPLEEFRRVLRPGGLASLVVPAGPRLFDAYDEYLGHYRRYGRRELARRAAAVGFDVLQDAYLGSLVFPAFWVVKKRNRRQAAGLGEAARRAIVSANISRTQDSRLGHWASVVERWLLVRRVHIPFGVRSWCVLRRPE